MTEPTRDLDTVIAELVGAAQTGAGVDPHHLAQELGAAGITAPETLRVVEKIMAQLVDADQRGGPVDPLDIARQIGAVHQGGPAQSKTDQTKTAQTKPAPSVPRQTGPAPSVSRGQMRFRCEQCGTMLFGLKAPAACPSCGGKTFVKPDLDQPNVESGAG